MDQPAPDIAAFLAPDKSADRLLTEALALAKGTRADWHELLRRLAGQRPFLQRLDTPKNYEAHPRVQLRLGRVLNALAANPTPSAAAALGGMASDPVFTEAHQRIDLLLLASGSVRPPPPALVAFWESRFRPGDAYTPLTVDVLFENRSPPALELLEKNITAPGHPDHAKLAWFRGRVLVRRNDPAVLGLCRRLLTGAAMPAHLRLPLAEVLFDHKPGEWFFEDAVKHPPSKLDMTDEARALRAEIGRFVIDKLNPDPRLEGLIRLELAVSEKK